MLHWDPEKKQYTERPGEGKEIRKRFQQACAVAHGVGFRMGANQLMELVYEKGLPSLEEREKILAERLKNAEGDDTPVTS